MSDLCCSDLLPSSCYRVSMNHFSGFYQKSEFVGKPPMTKPKLLIVGAFPRENSPIVGGIVTTCRVLIDSDFPKHFDLILIDSTQKNNPPTAFFARLLAAMWRTLRYCVVLVRERPDAVLLFTSLGASVLEKGAMAWMARFKKRPVFLFPRGAALIDEVRSRAWQRRCLIPMIKGATHFLCQGPAWQTFAIKDLGYREENAPIIYNWSATADLLKLGAEKVQYAEQAELQILFLGWLEQEKGIFELLEACRILTIKHAFVLTIVGRGNAEEKARVFVAEHDLGAYVKFEGWAYGQRKMNLLKSSDILVLPSWAEGFPNAIIEAMAVRIAVIVSAVGNVPDMLEHRKQAMIVPPKDVNALIGMLEELIINPHLRLEIAEEGFSYARENFSTQKGIQRLTDIIKDAMENYGVVR